MPTAPDAPSPRPARFWPTAVLLGVLGLHSVLAYRLFPSWGALVDDERPVILVDHAIHLYHGALGARFAREHGTTWGYDPFFMAGYPETPVWDSSSNLSIAFQLAAGGRYSPRAYKLGLFACSLLAVAVLPAGALAAGLGRSEAAAAGVLGLVVFWGCFPIALWRSGLFAFVTASAALGLVLGLLLRFDARPGPGRWGVLLVAGAVFLFAHVTAPVMALGGAVGYAAAVARRWRARRGRLAAVALAAGLAAVANAFWVVPLWRFRSIRTEAFSFLTTDSAWYLWQYFLHDPVDGRISLALVVLGAVGVAFWWAEGARCRAAVFGGTGVVLVGLTCAGSLWSVTKVLEPLRFRVTFDLLLTVPAGSALVRPASALARRAGGGWRGAAVAGLAGAAVAGAAWSASPETVPLLARQVAQDRPMVVGLRPEDRALVDWLREGTDLSARVLFEDQLRLLERTDPESTHWTPLLPVLLRPEGRAFLGGIYQTAFIAHHRAASFGDYGLGDRRIDAWTPADLSSYCEQYNVGWVVCWSPLSKFCFDGFSKAKVVATLPRAVSPGLRVCRDPVQWRALVARAGPEVASRYMLEGVGTYKVYLVERAHSYFLEGRGRLASLDANRVELADVAPDPATGAAVLSVHWLDTWKTDPPLPLSPSYAPRDPVPFVRIALDRPLPKVLLYNGY
jgi:hypothetical protein